MPTITTTGAARILSAAIGVRVRGERVARWAESGLLTDHSTLDAPRLRIDIAEATALGARLRRAPAGTCPHMAYRVSLSPLWESPLTDAQGNLWRTYAGVDHRHVLPAQERRRAVDGIWPVTASLADQLVAADAWLLAADAGAVTPEHARVITGWTRFEDRIAFTTRKADKALRAWVGTGLLLDVPRGPISALYF